MSQVETPIASPVSEADVAAITFLFKRLRERGRRIRIQASSATSSTAGKSVSGDEDNSENRPTPSKGE